MYNSASTNWNKIVRAFSVTICMLLLPSSYINFNVIQSSFSSYQYQQQELHQTFTIETHYLVAPSEEEYNITYENGTNLIAIKRLHRLILQILQFKKNGFFIECGAFDGVSLSNTLHLEMKFNWTGLLIEADPIYYKMLESKHRKAWIINACLAIRPEEHMIRMTRIKNQKALTRITELASKPFQNLPDAENFDAYCFPLMTLLNVLKQQDIDYLSLDIEGAELKVLKTIEWSSVYIKVISLESYRSKISEIKEYLATKNYQLVKYIRGPWIHDYVFVHKRLLSVYESKRRRKTVTVSLETVTKPS